MAQKKPAIYHIFVVEDHPAMRNALIRLLEREPDFVVCGEVATIAEALEQIPQAKPDLILVDVSLKVGNGITLVEQLQQEESDAACLIISGHDESIYAARALDAGARGYVMKGDPLTMIDAIRCVLSGKIYLSERMRQELSV